VHRVHREQSGRDPPRPRGPIRCRAKWKTPTTTRSHESNVDLREKDPRGAATGHPISRLNSQMPEWAVRRAAVIPMPVALGEVAPGARQRVDPWICPRTIGKVVKGEAVGQGPGGSHDHLRVGPSAHAAGARPQVVGKPRRISAATGATIERWLKGGSHPAGGRRFGNLDAGTVSGRCCRCGRACPPSVRNTRETSPAKPPPPDAAPPRRPRAPAVIREREADRAISEALTSAGLLGARSSARR